LPEVFPLMKSILVVCLGNICRSPMAEGVVRKALDEAGLAHVAVDSAGTSGWHEGGPPDPRAVKAALDAQRRTSPTSAPARSADDDFHRFDLILAMDGQNYARLKAMQPDRFNSNGIRMFMEFAGEVPVREVPDPYYGGEEGFDHALDLIELAARGLAAHMAAASG
jgi:protein-tyrosine phosphatase